MRAFDIEVPKAFMISTLIVMDTSGPCSYPLRQKFVINSMSHWSLDGFPPPYRKSGGLVSFHGDMPSERNFANTRW
jgi:hypothetical protein